MGKGNLTKQAASDSLKATIHNLVQRVGVQNVADWADSPVRDIYKFSNPNEAREITGSLLKLLARGADQAGYSSVADDLHSERTRLIEAKYGQARGEIDERIGEANMKLSQIQGLAKSGNAEEAFSRFKELEAALLDIRAELSAMDSKFEK